MTDGSEIRVDTTHAEMPEGVPARGVVKRGFAAMDRSLQRDIASKGGSSVPVAKRSFSRDHELAVRAGRKGGQARMRAAMQGGDVRPSDISHSSPAD